MGRSDLAPSGRADDRPDPHYGSRARGTEDAPLHTVLVSDDAVGFRTMLGAFLSDAGHDVSFGCTREVSVACATAQAT